MRLYKLNWQHNTWEIILMKRFPRIYETRHRNWFTLSLRTKSRNFRWIYYLTECIPVNCVSQALILFSHQTTTVNIRILKWQQTVAFVVEMPLRSNLWYSIVQYKDIIISMELNTSVYRVKGKFKYQRF